jgi:predicted ester cyclase
MTVAENKDLVRRYTAEMWAEGNIGNEAALRKYLCPSFRRHMSPTLPPLDLEGQIKWLAGIQSAFPNITITLEDLVREGDRVVLHGTLRGTHLGEIAGLSPTGKDVAVTVVDLICVENGQFTEGWGGPDVFDLVR